MSAAVELGRKKVAPVLNRSRNSKDESLKRYPINKNFAENVY
jgi:hypothetical protein